ncbi:MAG: hypothetical protein O9972_02815 [Burkholderiales bacterium]|nr:hypothetical protein [Burkholderiales bacterium]
MAEGDRGELDDEGLLPGRSRGRSGDRVRRGAEVGTDVRAGCAPGLRSSASTASSRRSLGLPSATRPAAPATRAATGYWIRPFFIA